jgi:hypothetical protein
MLVKLIMKLGFLTLIAGALAYVILIYVIPNI